MFDLWKRIIELMSSDFLRFLSRNLNKNGGADLISPLHIRIVLLVAILIGLVCLFMKTTKSSVEQRNDVEENAPLVSNPAK